MNASGESIKEVYDFYNIKPEELIVIYDDIDISKGKIKLRKKGGAGSHNGMKSVIKELGITDFTKNKSRNRTTRIQKWHDKLCYWKSTRRRTKNFTRRYTKSGRSSRGNTKKWYRYCNEQI